MVASGRGEFVSEGGGRVSFGPNDLLFAAAGVAHRFENFSDDFAVWVLFYGPEGGEVEHGARRRPRTLLRWVRMKLPKVKVSFQTRSRTSCLRLCAFA